MAHFIHSDDAIEAFESVFRDVDPGSLTVFRFLLLFETVFTKCRIDMDMKFAKLQLELKDGHEVTYTTICDARMFFFEVINNDNIEFVVRYNLNIHTVIYSKDVNDYLDARMRVHILSMDEVVSLIEHFEANNFVTEPDLAPEVYEWYEKIEYLCKFSSPKHFATSLCLSLKGKWLDRHVDCVNKFYAKMLINYYFYKLLYTGRWINETELVTQFNLSTEVWSGDMDVTMEKEYLQTFVLFWDDKIKSICSAVDTEPLLECLSLDFKNVEVDELSNVLFSSAIENHPTFKNGITGIIYKCMRRAILLADQDWNNDDNGHEEKSYVFFASKYGVFHYRDMTPGTVKTLELVVRDLRQQFWHKKYCDKNGFVPFLDFLEEMNITHVGKWMSCHEDDMKRKI